MSKIKLDKKTIFAAAFGAALEWYDFSIFIFLTPIITQLFFPELGKLVGLMASFGLFAAGYLMRPLGGIIFGSLGDRIGRKKILQITTGLMAIPMIGTAILPSTHSIGIAAVIILLLLRMLQGLSVGGEYTGVLVMLLEQAPLKHRALVTSSASVISGIGTLLSSGTIVLLNYAFSHTQILNWGWRIPFLIGFFLALYSYFLQNNMHESPYFEDAKRKQKIKKSPFFTVIKTHPKEIFYVFLLAGFLGIAYYLGLTFFPSYLTNILHVPIRSASMLSFFSTLIYLFFIPFAAVLSDRIGRRPVLLTSIGLLIIAPYPAFMLISSGNLGLALLGNTLILSIYGCAVAVFVTLISELFPTEERFSGVATGYNIGNAIFGGTTPLIATYLITVTGNHMAPAYYLSVAAIITLLLLIKMPETNPIVLNRKK
jgi:MFS transporter, MHS family, proline/betaine transporter